MTSLAAGIVDPTKAGKYPVVLSDALLGKDPKDIFTGVRYNHKPSLSNPTAPAQARIKQASTSSKKTPSTYDLSFQDDGGRYQYKGTRGVEDSQYVLIFDATREVFVLHKVDSMFNMNLVQTPTNDNAQSLRQEYPQLDSHSISSSARAAGPATGGKKSAKVAGEEKKTTAKPRKPASKAKEDKPALVMPEKKPPPKPTATATKKPGKASADEDEDSSDDDLGLTIENPGGGSSGPARDFSPGFLEIRRFSDIMHEDEDADGEEDDDDNFEHFKLPSPINRQMQETSVNQQPTRADEDEEEEDDEMEDVQQEQPVEIEEPVLDDESELEAALMAELAEADQAESDVSEEE
ncbi:RNA polymerase II transcription elongation factor-domain-containing protein [Hypoxylon trugodes]|uniref:RNA polymerase II transcription elongation factor-domain-containing protein n=1 Tax=Hypoxylon trugodes TaxID=326681 RepID=UPI0021946B57|nr:RNA polymerase II transcription elongation factor-domain-containing protein [Hypoxylon trugodes]KAI1392269.1 RNA polymerase II transcription elongation factor-domain-containing protein [Hypoxylon trugodes]